MVPADYHSHHHRCGHAVGEMCEYALAAAAAGMRRFGVSDHGPAWWFDTDHAQPATQMAVSEFPRYLEDARLLVEEMRHTIPVSVGVEADWIPGRSDELARWLDRPGIDHVLGSVHYSLGSSIFKRDRWLRDDPEQVFRDYYGQVADAARSGLFDILSHLTAVEAYAPVPPAALADGLYPAVADAVAESGCIVEINTSGLRKRPDRDEPFPNRRMLRLLVERDVPLTFGADSHRPSEVGFGAAQVVEILRELGVDPQRDLTEIRVRRGPLLAWRRGARTLDQP
ncbi:MAG: histidinol-phosphatase [Armatimonadota bacterium]